MHVKHWPGVYFGLTPLHVQMCFMKTLRHACKGSLSSFEFMRAL